MIRLDPELVRHALKTASDHGFASVELGLGDDKFEAKLLPRKQKKVHSPKDSDAAGRNDKVIASPAVGYFRFAKKPLTVGMTVEEGDVVAEIVALGLSNDIVTKWSGAVTEILVEADQPVEYGQPIARVEINHG